MTEPEAPALFSMTIGVPSDYDIFSCTMRAAESAPPPGATWTMSLIIRLGKAVCARPCILFTYKFELRTVIWTVAVPTSVYDANTALFDAPYMNADAMADGRTTMDVIQSIFLKPS